MPTTTSEHAVEGTTFHNYMEKVMGAYLKYGTSMWSLADDLISDCAYPDMPEVIWDTTQDMIERWEGFKARHTDAKMYLELRVHVSEDCYGTADVVMVGKHNGLTNIVVLDYKAGRGVKVNAEGNLQGLAYLIGAVNTLGITKIGRAAFVVNQMRIEDGWEYVEYSPADLREYEGRILSIVDKVKKIYDGELSEAANMSPGAHCRFCPANGRCVAQRAVVVTDAPEFSPEKAAHVSTDQLVELFLKKKQIEAVLEAAAVELHRRIAAGETHPDVKLVRTKGTRKWLPTVTAKDLKEIGVEEPEVVEVKLKGITAVEREIGKGKIDALTQVSEGRVELVESGDKRPALDDGPSELGESNGK